MSSCTTCAKVGPNLFVHNENSACIMSGVSDVICTLRSAHMQATWPPYVYVVCQELLMDVPLEQAK